VEMWYKSVDKLCIMLTALLLSISMIYVEIKDIERSYDSGLLNVK